MQGEGGFVAFYMSALVSALGLQVGPQVELGVENRVHCQAGSADFFCADGRQDLCCWLEVVTIWDGLSAATSTLQCPASGTFTTLLRKPVTTNRSWRGRFPGPNVSLM